MSRKGSRTLRMRRCIPRRGMLTRGKRARVRRIRLRTRGKRSRVARIRERTPAKRSRVVRGRLRRRRDIRTRPPAMRRGPSETHVHRLLTRASSIAGVRVLFGHAPASYRGRADPGTVRPPAARPRPQKGQACPNKTRTPAPALASNASDSRGNGSVAGRVLVLSRARRGPELHAADVLTRAARERLDLRPAGRARGEAEASRVGARVHLGRRPVTGQAAEDVDRAAAGEAAHGSVHAETCHVVPARAAGGCARAGSCGVSRLRRRVGGRCGVGGRGGVGGRLRGVSAGPIGPGGDAAGVVGCVGARAAIERGTARRGAATAREEGDGGDGDDTGEGKRGHGGRARTHAPGHRLSARFPADLARAVCRREPGAASMSGARCASSRGPARIARVRAARWARTPAGPRASRRRS